MHVPVFLILAVLQLSIPHGSIISKGFFVLVGADSSSSIQSVIQKSNLPTSLVQPIHNKIISSIPVNIEKLEASSPVVVKPDGTKSTMSKAIFNLVKGIVGAGVLSLPAGTKQILFLEGRQLFYTY